MTDKIKLFTISDHPLVNSGVGIQTRYILEGLLKTGDYQIHSFGGAMRHSDYRPLRLQEHGDNWIIWPVDGYGNQTMVREIFDTYRYDALWFMTDPRFYIWLSEMMDEISARDCAVLYNHVWDEFPVPHYNKGYYLTCDFIGCISKLTYRIMEELGLRDRAQYIPHAVDHNVFKPLNWSASELRTKRAQYIGLENANKFVVFYNSRNARRKMTADVLAAFKGLLDRVGQDKAFLFMHTDPNDQEGPNLHAVAQMLGLQPNQYKFSSANEPPHVIAEYNNMIDVLVNISNNEGFGLSCLEALSCGRLAVVNKTGGLTDQIISDEGTVFGVALEPTCHSIQGSQHIPYIYDCRLADSDVVDALERLYKMPAEMRRALGKKAHEWTLKAFSMKGMIESWDNAIKSSVERKRSAGNNVRIAYL